MTAGAARAEHSARGAPEAGAASPHGLDTTQCRARLDPQAGGFYVPQQHRYLREGRRTRPVHCRKVAPAMTRPFKSLAAAIGALVAAGSVAVHLVPAAAAPGEDKPVDAGTSHDPQGLDKEEGVVAPPPGADALGVAVAAEADIEEAFPETFAGMWVVDEYQFMVAFSQDPGEAFSSFLSNYFAQRTANLDAVPKFDVVLVEHSKAELTGVEKQIAADARLLEAEGFPDVSTYLDPKRNKVVIQTSTTDEQTLRRLAERYGPNEVVVRGSFQRLIGSRTSDTPAWNGGNKMIAPDGTQCTTGFGRIRVGRATCSRQVTAGTAIGSTRRLRVRLSARRATSGTRQRSTTSTGTTCRRSSPTEDPRSSSGRAPWRPQAGRPCRTQCGLRSISLCARKGPLRARAVGPSSRSNR